MDIYVGFPGILARIPKGILRRIAERRRPKLRKLLAIILPALPPEIEERVREVTLHLYLVVPSHLVSSWCGAYGREITIGAGWREGEDVILGKLAHELCHSWQSFVDLPIDPVSFEWLYWFYYREPEATREREVRRAARFFFKHFPREVEACVFAACFSLDGQRWLKKTLAAAFAEKPEPGG